LGLTEERDMGRGVAVPSHCTVELIRSYNRPDIGGRCSVREDHVEVERVIVIPVSADGQTVKKTLDDVLPTGACDNTERTSE